MSTPAIHRSHAQIGASLMPILPSKLKGPAKEPFIQTLIAEFQEEIEEDRIAPLLLSLMHAAQKDPGFKTGDEKRAWVSQIFIEVVSRILFKADQQWKKGLLLECAEDLISASKAIARENLLSVPFKEKLLKATSPILNPLPAPTAAFVAPPQDLILEQRAEKLFHTFQADLRNKDLIPLLFSIYAIFKEWNTLTKEEANQMRNDLATKLLDRAFSQRSTDELQEIAYEVLVKLVPIFFAVFDEAETKIEELAKSIREKGCCSCCIL